MLEKPRQYRAVIMGSSAKSAEEAWQLLPNSVASGSLTSREKGAAAGRVLLGHFLSSTAYSADEDLLQKIAIRRSGVVLYRYDVYVCEWRTNRSTMLAFLVPFSDMASEFFGAVDESTKSTNRMYRRANLSAMTELLSGAGEIAGEFSATSAHFLLGGNDLVKGVRLVGENVFASLYYRMITAQLDGLTLDPKKLGLVYAHDQGSLTFSTDDCGNFWFRLGKNGEGINLLASMFKSLEKSGLVDQVQDFPVSG